MVLSAFYNFILSEFRQVNCQKSYTDNCETVIFLCYSLDWECHTNAHVLKAGWLPNAVVVRSGALGSYWIMRALTLTRN